MTTPAHRRPARLLALLLIVSPLLIGCGSKEEIRSYPITKEAEQTSAPPVDSARPVGNAELTDRMLGAILPAGRQTWYFKAVGPAAAMDKNADAISAFFQTIRVSPDAAKPEWKIPEGWNEQAGSGMRAATLMIPADGKPIEMSVIAMPSTGAPGELRDNVNRWRGQLQLPPVDERGLAATVKEAKVGDATMSLVDLRGQFSAGSMTAPFAGGGPFSGGARPPGNAPFANGAGQPGAPDAPGAPPSAELPPGHPPVDGDHPVNEPASAPFTSKAPDVWQQQPASGMRKAAFLVKDGDRSAEVTVIDLLGSAPSVADPLENVNRWRGEVGLEPVQQDQLAGIVQKIEVDGKPSDYVELIPDAAKPAESQADKATLAAIVPVGKTIWFFKMKGDREFVVAQRDNFKSFLESVRFASDGGAGDGN
jgi:hypothetical protein